MAQVFKVPAIPDVIFTSYEAAQKAVEAKKKEEEESKAQAGIDRYNRVMNIANAPLESSTDIAMKGPEPYMPNTDEFGRALGKIGTGARTYGAPEDYSRKIALDRQAQEITRAAEKETLQEMFNSGSLSKIGMAREFGLTGSTAPSAESFVSGIKDEMTMDEKQRQLQNQKDLYKYKSEVDLEADMKKKAMESSGKKFSPEEQNSVRDFLTRVDKDVIVRRSTQSVSAARPIMEVLKLKNPVGDNAIRILIPRLMGEVGNLAQAEQQAYGGSEAIVGKLKQVYENAKTGRLTDLNRQYLWDLAVTMHKSGAATLSNRLEQMIPQEVQLSGVDEDKLRSVVGTYTNFDRFEVGNYPWKKSNEQETSGMAGGWGVDEDEDGWTVKDGMRYRVRR